VSYPGSRTQRVIAKEPFVNGKLITVPIAKNSCYIGFLIRIVGSVTATWASGTPVAKVEGLMDSILQRIDVTENGKDTFKSLKPHFLAIQDLITQGVENERYAEVGATALTNKHPTTRSGFLFGTTGQVTSVRESVYLPFEQVHCEPGYGREMTWWNTRHPSVNSADLKIQCGNIADILKDGNATAVTYTNVDLTIEITAIENKSVPENALFHVWKQTFTEKPFSGQTRDSSIEMPKENYLSGMMFYTKNGDASRTPTNDLIDVYSVRTNGTQYDQTAAFKALQQLNRRENGSTAEFAGGTSRLDGIGFVNFLNERKINSALPAKRALGIDSLDLMINTHSYATYTPNQAMLNVVFDEIIFRTAKEG
jgi:hypothetical protein